MTFCVRLIKPEDVPRVARMAVANVRETRPYQDVDPEAVERVVMAAAGGEGLSILVAEKDGEPVGMLAWCVYPMFFNPADIVSQEMGLYVFPEARSIDMVRTMVSKWEALSRQTGCTHSMMTSPIWERTAGMQRLYKMIGYTPIEVGFMKEL